ncbi:1,4-dihydroxy-2-naphthoate polyprenyltransferase [Jeotgalibaca sp. MA1X17-3]|uniref:1,4-dihydroxy-2-naphthoate polyprenyltransferase n=1 Tax=Jeotgalibaca sp. MA1X17-3 TaxID=2908211 RepID=UPI001F4362A4|nr:1,4-dihydroxy-2-naphthoate polyprenyltransferase [Jeotgalibaca sp. MA1X17-3]UJF15753.1 1,4-dihydroxy-2-naphthoate polyprenyltransferase [Jeotgalibaca sp. MA1X17-3]
MSTAVFLELVEIRTKVASFFPFILGVLYAGYYFQSFQLINTVLFFLAMIIFDMATTAINNTMDYVKAKNITYQQQENILGKANLSVKKVTLLIIAMIGTASLLGLLLTYRTNLLLLVMGIICFLIGIFYTFGPFPISRMPLGEVLSGLTMGFGIFFIAVFVNVPVGQLAGFQLSWPMFTLTGNIQTVLIVFLQSIPIVCTIANIMLSNNLCDLETDISNHRYTLTYYIGKTAAIKLYAILYYVAYFSITLAVLLRVSPIWMIAVWLTFPIVQRNIKRFSAVQEKATTFSLAIKNLVIIHSLQIILLILGIIF